MEAARTVEKRYSVAITKPGAWRAHEISLKAIWLYLAARLPRVPKAAVFAPRYLYFTKHPVSREVVDPFRRVLLYLSEGTAAIDV